jgi:hypothetical protein
MVTKDIGACKTLKRFECTQPRPLADEMWFGGLISAFFEHTESLEKLSIGADMEDHDRKPYGYVHLDSLSDFISLKSLGAPFNLISTCPRTKLFGHRLPLNLERLRFEVPTRAGMEMKLHLLTLIRRIAEGQFLRLQSMEIDWAYAHDLPRMPNLQKMLPVILRFKE